MFIKVGTIHYVVTTTKDELNDISKHERYYCVDMFHVMWQMGPIKFNEHVINLEDFGFTIVATIPSLSKSNPSSKDEFL